MGKGIAGYNCSHQASINSSNPHFFPFKIIIITIINFQCLCVSICVCVFLCECLCGAHVCVHYRSDVEGRRHTSGVSFLPLAS